MNKNHKNLQSASDDSFSTTAPSVSIYTQIHDEPGAIVYLGSACVAKAGGISRSKGWDVLSSDGATNSQTELSGVCFRRRPRAMAGQAASLGEADATFC